MKHDVKGLYEFVGFANRIGGITISLLLMYTSFIIYSDSNTFIAKNLSLALLAISFISLVFIPILSKSKNFSHQGLMLAAWLTYIFYSINNMFISGTFSDSNLDIMLLLNLSINCIFGAIFYIKYRNHDFSDILNKNNEYDFQLVQKNHGIHEFHNIRIFWIFFIGCMLAAILLFIIGLQTYSLYALILSVFGMEVFSVYAAMRGIHLYHFIERTADKSQLLETSDFN